MSQGNYAIPGIEFDIAVAVTNTTPMGAYRGAGRPEATAMLERLVDQAAIELADRPDRAAPAATSLADDVFPYTTLIGHVYDSGSYALPLRRRGRGRSATTTLRAEQARPARPR